MARNLLVVVLACLVLLTRADAEVWLSVLQPGGNSCESGLVSGHVDQAVNVYCRVVESARIDEPTTSRRKHQLTAFRNNSWYMGLSKASRVWPLAK